MSETINTIDKFRGGLTQDTVTNYTGRVNYSEFIEYKKSELGIRFIDTVQDKILYGFIDHEFFGVETNAELKSFGDYAGEIVGINYVVECFNAFRDFYIRFTSESPDISIPAPISGLIAKRSYESMADNYIDFQRLVSQALIEPFSSGEYSQGVLSFEDFIVALNNVIFKDENKQYKVTKLGFILSRYISAFQTGLYIDLAPELNPSIDYVKVDLVSDPGFECYGQSANRYGFYVDQNCPWRLVLDLDSPVVRENILNSDFSRPFQDFYSQQYLLRVGGDDYWELKSFYKRMYIKYMKLKDIQVLQRSVLDSIPEPRWIEIYIMNRLRELGEFKLKDYQSSDSDPTLPKEKYQNILTNAMDKYNILHMQGLSRLTHNSGVILYIEQVCADLLKARIERTKIDIANSRRREQL